MNDCYKFARFPNFDRPSAPATPPYTPVFPEVGLFNASLSTLYYGGLTTGTSPVMGPSPLPAAALSTQAAAAAARAAAAVRMRRGVAGGVGARSSPLIDERERDRDGNRDRFRFRSVDTSYDAAPYPQRRLRLRERRERAGVGIEAAAAEAEAVEIGREVKSGETQEYYGHRAQWRHPGGAASLLQILTRRLRRIEDCLKDIKSIASRYDFVRKTKLVWVFSGFVAILIITASIEKPVKFILIKWGQLTTFIFNSLNKIALFESSRLIRNSFGKIIPQFIRELLTDLFSSIWNHISVIANYARDLTFIESMSNWIVRFRLLVLPTCIYLLHRATLHWKLRRVARLTNELNLVIMFFILIMNALTPSVCVLYIYIFNCACICIPLNHRVY